MIVHIYHTRVNVETFFFMAVAALFAIFPHMFFYSPRTHMVDLSHNMGVSSLFPGDDTA